LKIPEQTNIDEAIFDLNGLTVDYSMKTAIQKFRGEEKFSF
jgi:hypothetical protein